MSVFSDLARFGHLVGTMPENEVYCTELQEKESAELNSVINVDSSADAPRSSPIVSDRPKINQAQQRTAARAEAKRVAMVRAADMVQRQQEALAGYRGAFERAKARKDPRGMIAALTDDGAAVLDFELLIFRGEVSAQIVDKATGQIVEVTPSIETRRDSGRYLFEHLYGKAPSKVEVRDTTTNADDEIDLSKLTPEDLHAWLDLRRKLKPNSGETIEGALVDTKD